MDETSTGGPSHHPSAHLPDGVNLHFHPMIKGYAIIDVVGDLDATSANDLRELDQRTSEASQVAIDLRRTSFMDSAGLGALLSLVRSAINREASATLVCGPGPVQRLLHVTGVDRWAQVTDDLPADGSAKI